MLLPGADNWAHFQIFTTMRAYGAILTQLPPAPGGGSWGFTGYPAGFHSTVASVAELPAARHWGRSRCAGALHPQRRASSSCSVLAGVTAAVASLPRLEDRPWVCAAVVTLP